MSEILGTIKILDGKIITKKEGVTETWSRWLTGDESTFIVYDGITYRLVKSDGDVSASKKKYLEEDDSDDDVPFFREDF